MGNEGIEGIVEVPKPTGFDTTRTFVRVVERRPDGFVEFHFAIGDPELFVEMFLTEPAFDELCAHHHASIIEPVVPDDARGLDREDSDEWHWTMRDATHQRFKELADASEHEKD